MSVIPMPKRQVKPRVRKNQNKKVQFEFVAPTMASIQAASGGVSRGAPISRKGKRRNRARKGRSGFSGQFQPLFPSARQVRSKRSQIIEEDEYIAVISGTTSSTVLGVTSFPINPGQALTFPWLSKEAQLFEKYKFDELEFYYKPMVSAYATNGQAGKIILSVDYDAADAPPTTIQQVEDTEPRVDAMPYQSVGLALDPREMFQLSDAKYVRPGGLPGSTDIKTYDCGVLNVGTLGNAATSVLGELRVRYRCTLMVPVLENTASAPLNNQVTTFHDNNYVSFTTATPAADPIAVRAVSGAGGVNSAGQIVLPAGNYNIDWNVQGIDTVSEEFTLSVALYDVTSGSYLPTIPPLIGPITVGAGGSLFLSGTAFYSSNGTDAIELRTTLIGAAGTLTAAGFMRITAV